MVKEPQTSHTEKTLHVYALAAAFNGYRVSEINCAVPEEKGRKITWGGGAGECKRPNKSDMNTNKHTDGAENESVKQKDEKNEKANFWQG